MYRCLRNSSALEGYHYYLRWLCDDSFKSCGEDWLWTIIRAFDFRWSVRAGRVGGLYDPAVKHFDMRLRDALNGALRGLIGAKTLSETTLHIDVVDREPKIRHGLHFAREVRRQQSLVQEAEVLELAEQDGGSASGALDLSRLHMHPTATDAEALLNSPAALDMDGPAIAKVALALGLVWTSERAETFLKATAQKEKLYLQLAKQNYLEFFQSQLHAPVLASMQQRASGMGAGLMPAALTGPLAPLPWGSRPIEAVAPSVETLAAVIATQVERRPGPKNKDMSPESRKRADRANARNRPKRRKNKEQVFVCDHNCGFAGAYKEVLAHEKKCDSRPFENV
jgi:hypothetical protein